MSNPKERHDRILGLIDKINSNDKFEEWRIKVNQSAAEVIGIVLIPPLVIDKGSSKPWADYESGYIKI